jgi:hypothetical protein
MRMLTSFDCFVLAIGTIGTLNVFKLPIMMPEVVAVISWALSALICCFSILLLGVNRFVPRLNPRQQRIHIYYVLVTLIPTIYILTHLKETPWERFVF